MIVKGRIRLGDGTGVSWLRIEDGVVVEHGRGDPGPVDLALEGDLVPGFVDPHVHGAVGADFGDCDAEAARRAVRFHAAAGSTTLVATLASASLDHLVEQIARLRPLVDDGTLAGLHLEGPFLSYDFRGAHDPSLLRAPTEESVDRLLDAGGDALTTITLAPELPCAREAIRRLVASGVHVQLGHTGCTAQEAQAALDDGAGGFTHLCNGMPPLAGRAPGPVGAALLARSALVEVIGDGTHLDDATIDLVRAVAPDRVGLVSDAMAATGLGDGDHVLAGSAVRVRDGVARTSTGALAGATRPLAEAVVRLAGRGAQIEEIVRLSSSNAARALGLRRGLAIGDPADLVQLVRTPGGLEVGAVLRAGVLVPEG